METVFEEPLELVEDFEELVRSVYRQSVAAAGRDSLGLSTQLTAAQCRYPFHVPDTGMGVFLPGSLADAYNFRRLTSTASAAAFSAFIANSTSGRPSHDGDQHLEMKFQTSSESHSLEPGGRAGRSPMTTLYMITPSLAPGNGCCPVMT